MKFGTDGIRGVANSELTVELSLALGRAAVRVLGGQDFLIGRDTRVSGPAISAALAAGMASEGANVCDVGVLPTPAVAHLSNLHSRPAAMVSASHNAYADNGIKFFLPGGKKLTDDIEERLEAELYGSKASASRAVSSNVGLVDGSAHGASWAAYGAHVRDSMKDADASGLRVVVDCANGAASEGVEQIFRELGVDVVVINAEPNGMNINDNCGSTHPQGLQSAVVAHGAQVGLGLDGDADRVLAVDETGQLIDGDQMMCLFASDMKSRGILASETLVVTVMSNLGLHRSMQRQGIKVHSTAVGDRYVLEALDANKWSLGGEQSGHIVFPDIGATGDGIMTGALLLSVVKRGGGSLHDLAAQAMTRYPQVLTNVVVKDRTRLDSADAVWQEVKAVEQELGDDGRVLLRPSGTESLIRVMVEAADATTANDTCARLCAVVEKHV